MTEIIIGHIATYEIEKKANFEISNEQKIELLKNSERRKKIIDDTTKQIQTTLFANCWFISNKESIAMWNLYSNSDSVAIRYNPDELLKIVIASANSYNHDDFKSFLYGIVEYDDIWPFNIRKRSDLKIKYTPYKKDKSYIHENEFRFTVAVPKDKVEKYENFELPLGDIQKDNFKIFANPKMDEWKFQNLKKLLELDKFKLSDKLEKSVLKIKIKK